MAPTRELAKQVCDNFSSISDGLVCTSIYGGAPYEKQGENSFPWLEPRKNQQTLLIKMKPAQCLVRRLALGCQWQS